MAIVYAIKIAKRLQEILSIIKEETEKITHDVDAVRERIKNGGSQFVSFVSYLWSFFNKSNKKSRKNNK